MARDLELEAAIIRDPENDQLYRVYADWLEAQGDLRAQLIRAQLADRFGETARQLIEEHGEELLGPLAKFERALLCQRGFVDSANLTERTRLEAGPCLKALLAHPMGALLTSLEIYTHEPAAVVEALPQAPATLRSLRFFSPSRTASLHGIGHVLVRLKRLTLDGMFDLALPLELPLAVDLELEIEGLSEANADLVARGHFPQLQGLTIGLAKAFECHDKLAPLFARDLPRLESLVITEADELDAMCELVATAPFAPQLKHLELAGTLTASGVETLRNCDRLQALQTLTVKAALEPGVIATLQRAGLELAHQAP